MYRNAVLCLAAAIAPFALPAPAIAQGTCARCTLPPGDRGVGSDGNNGQGQVTLTIQSDIDFGRLVLIGSGVGQVLLDLQTGAKQTIGNVNDLGGISFSGRAVVTGKPLKTINVSFPSTITMSDGAGATAELTDFRTDLPPAPVLGASGTMEFRFTGTLRTTSPVGGNLRGRIPIRVGYN